MLNELERGIIKKWNDFTSRPRNNITGFREDLEKFCVEMGLNDDLPVIGALHENVELRGGLLADVSVPKGNGPHPVTVFIHGGGWMAGSLATHRKLGMQFCRAGLSHDQRRLQPRTRAPLPRGLRRLCIRGEMGRRKRPALERGFVPHNNCRRFRRGESGRGYPRSAFR